MWLQTKEFRILVLILALVLIIPFIFFFDSKPKESLSFRAESRVIRANFEFEKNVPLIFLDGNEVSVWNTEEPSRSGDSVLNRGVHTSKLEDLNLEFLNSSVLDSKSLPKEGFPLRKTSEKKEKFFAEISDRILDPLDPVFVYLSEDKFLTLQFDFFLNVTLSSAQQLNQLLTPSVALSNIRKMENDLFGSNLFDLAVILGGEGNRKLKSYQSFVSLFRMNRIDFNFTSVNLKRLERSFVSFKFHRYFALLFSFPPNFPEGQTESC